MFIKKVKFSFPFLFYLLVIVGFTLPKSSYAKPTDTKSCLLAKISSFKYRLKGKYVYCNWVNWPTYLMPKKRNCRSSKAVCVGLIQCCSLSGESVTVNVQCTGTSRTKSCPTNPFNYEHHNCEEIGTPVVKKSTAGSV